ncbi:hypothetical protein [Brachybacterium sp. Marseille-Q7125]|uniref:hypothetical protein n=1 Tax=Brachybacterium sp. Marseille-Q7125 TaxID=2932815 RepID=UPI001FF44FCF|nr:hypothetical protein [Brachybacterium sp. Marseille-Q7125]
MGILRGNGEHGPGGDPSWLGGKDRDPSPDAASQPPSTEAAGTPAPSPDFVSDFTPQFSSQADGDYQPAGSDTTGGFAASTAHGSKPPLAKIGFSLFSQLIVLVFIMFTMYRVGFGNWWFVMFFALPILVRTGKQIKQAIDEFQR